MNYRFDIQYDGTRYGGWQRQKTTENTIQGKIEEVLSRMTGNPVQIQGAGRTDAGVHALGQVANGHLDTPMSCEEICEYMNHYLPEDIEILQVCQVSDRFHSRLNAKEKLYRYRIGTGSHKNVFERKYLCPLHETYNVKSMEQAVGYLTGTHDFKSFCSNKKMKKPTVRTLYEIRLTQLTNELQIDYRGEGFLYNGADPDRNPHRSRKRRPETGGDSGYIGGKRPRSGRLYGTGQRTDTGRSQILKKMGLEP